jgi:predicted amidohydrolase YtcJ
MWVFPYVGWYDRLGPDGRTWTGLQSMDAVVDALAAICAEWDRAGKPAEQPLVAWGFDPIYFGSERMTVQHLDRASASRPVVVCHSNGHVMNVNTPMMAMAGITRETEIEGVVKFASGEPTGELQEPAAMFPVARRLGPSGSGLLAPMDLDGMLGFGAIACMQGVTTATDLVNQLAEHDVDVLLSACAREDYNVRVLPAFKAFHGTYGAQDGVARIRQLQAQHAGMDRLRFGVVKMMLDGSIQGFSARMRWPGYFNGHANGIWVTSPEQYEADFETYHRAGFVIHTHTNGDEASLAAIEAIERVLERAPRPDHRHTLQHGQMIDAAMFRRMARLGLCANLFANHIWYWGDQHAEMTMGPDRAARLDACGSALAAGVPLAIHSDAPVTPLGPLFTAWCAVNRVTASGQVLGENERIGVPQALHAITLGAAWTLKLDHEIGSIEVGKRADLCVLEDDPLAVDPMALKDVRIWGTMLSGRVFEAATMGHRVGDL